MRSKLWILLAVLFSLSLSSAIRAAEMSDKDKEKNMDEKEKRRRATLRAAGIDPDAASKKAAAPAPNTAAAPASPASAGGKDSYTFNITGMMCRNCEASVTSSFKKSAGVLDVKADEKAGTAVVSYDSTKTTLDKILEEFKKDKAARFEIFKQGEKPQYNYSGKEEAFKGPLLIKDPSSGADVVCRINAHRSGEAAERIFNVIATGEMATQLEKLRKEGLREVNITGIASDEGIKLTKIQ